MAFRRTELAGTKELELPTFIDVVFLLLIFFLLTYSPVSPKKGEAALQLTLPVAKGMEKVRLSEQLQTMLIEVLPVNAKDLSQGYQVSVLLPFQDYSILATRPRTITVAKAREYAKIYHRQGFLPANYAVISKREFKKLDVVKMLDREIDKYVRYRFRIPKPTNRIEIRADASVKFRLINFILTKCSSYEDLVPMIVFRTMYQKE